MKRVLFCLVLSMALAASVSAGLTTITSPPGVVEAGWNLVTVPGIPVNPAPESVFSDPALPVVARWRTPEGTHRALSLAHKLGDTFRTFLLQPFTSVA